MKPLHIRAEVWAATWEYLRRQGHADNEGVVYWGFQKNTRGQQVIGYEKPQTYRRVGPYSAVVGFDELVRIGTAFFENGMFIGARVHSHREGSFHSEVDDGSPVTGKPGFLSIVVGQFPTSEPDLDQVGVYEYEGEGKWRTWPRDETRKRFVIGGPA